MKSNLARLSFYNTIFTILIFSTVLAFTLYQFSDNLYNQKVKKLEEKFYSKNKVVVKNEVNRIVRDIITIRENSYNNSMNDLKEKVEIVQNLFNNTKNINNKSTLLKKYRNILDVLKWDNNTGYIYIYDEKGNIFYHGDNKNLEKKNIFNLSKENKPLYNLFMKSFSQNKSLGSYKWVKPNHEKNTEYDKFAYILKNNKYDLFIVVGMYKDEIDKKVLTLIKKEIYTNRFGETNYGYFWIHGLDEYLKIHPIQTELENKSLANVKSVYGINVIPLMNKVALDGGGFVSYSWQRPDNKKVDTKTSYVQLIKGWPLVIGSGFYLTELITILNEEKADLKKSTNEYLINIITILIGMIIIVFFITKFISLKIRKVENERSNQMNMLKQYKLLLDKSSVVSKMDSKGYLTYVNNEFEHLSKYKKDEILGKSYSVIVHPKFTKKESSQLWKKILGGNIWIGIVQSIDKDGITYYCKNTIVPIKDENGNIVEYISSGNDLTELFSLHKEIEDTQKEVIYKMGEIGETRSKETGNHVKRVAEYSRLLSQLYGLDENQSDILYTASPMHDIGKVGIEDSILKKPGKLTPIEFEVMKTHAEIGFNILKGSQSEVLKAAAIVAGEHHEKWDGTGYPKGLKAEDIHIYGRITALADVFDALGSTRCYKNTWEDDEIFALLKEQSGKQFEPKLISLFFENFEKFDAIRQKLKDS